MRDDEIQLYAVWLIPNDEQRALLLSIIQSLAGKCGSPMFKPHITLISGLHDGPLSDLSQLLASFSEKLNTVRFDIAGVNWRDNYFTFLYLELVDRSAIFERAAATFPGSHTPQVGPHLSLVYSDRYDDIDRASLAKDLVSKLPGNLLCTEVELVMPVGDDWRDVDHWSSQAISTLGLTANRSPAAEVSIDQNPQQGGEFEYAVARKNLPRIRLL